MKGIVARAHRCSIINLSWKALQNNRKVPAVETLLSKIAGQGCNLTKVKVPVKRDFHLINYIF